MLSTTSGFTPDQAQRFRSLFHVLLAGLAVLTFGVGILCFGRMYTFDSSRYDLFTVFGVIIVPIGVMATIVPVYCQLRVYLEVRREAKADAAAISGDYGPVAYAPPVYQHPGMAGQPQSLAAPYGTGAYQHQQQQQQQQQQHHMPFSSATYMMGKQQPMSMPMPMPMAQRADDTMRQQGHGPIWSSTEKQQPL